MRTIDQLLKKFQGWILASLNRDVPLNVSMDKSQDEKTQRQYFSLLSQINNAVTENDLQPVYLKIGLFDKENEGTLANVLSDNLWDRLQSQRRMILLESEQIDCLLNEVNAKSNIKITTK